jgi:hypothetical protein
VKEQSATGFAVLALTCQAAILQCVVDVDVDDHGHGHSDHLDPQCVQTSVAPYCTPWMPPVFRCSECLRSAYTSLYSTGETQCSRYKTRMGQCLRPMDESSAHIPPCLMLTSTRIPLFNRFSGRVCSQDTPSPPAEWYDHTVELFQDSIAQLFLS